MGNKFISSSLKHYGVKGQKWGVINTDIPLVINKPFTLSKDLPKVEPRPSSIGKINERVKMEVADDTKNRIKDLKDVPRFNPKDETIDLAMRKINEGRQYNSLIDASMADEYGLYDEHGNIKHFGNNCGSATFAYELRRRGLDVEAGLTGGISHKEIANSFGISMDEFHEAQKKQGIPPKTIEELEAILKAMGPGARGFCIMRWEKGAGHINAFEINAKGEVVYIDAQSGITSRGKATGPSNPAEYYKYSKEYFVIRVDNHKMNSDVVKDWVRLDDRTEPFF